MWFGGAEQDAAGFVRVGLCGVFAHGMQHGLGNYDLHSPSHPFALSLSKGRTFL